jgi:hypothetical protein
MSTPDRPLRSVLVRTPHPLLSTTTRGVRSESRVVGSRSLAQTDPHPQTVLALTLCLLLSTVTRGCTDAVYTRRQSVHSGRGAIRNVWTVRKPRVQQLTAFPPTLHRPPSRITTSLESWVVGDTTLNFEFHLATTLFSERVTHPGSGCFHF